jgi:hypothetical protein
MFNQLGQPCLKNICILFIYIYFINIYINNSYSKEILSSINISNKQGFDQYESDFSNSGEKGTSNLKFEYSVLSLGFEFTSFEVLFQIDSKNKEAIDRDIFTFPLYINTQDNGLSRATKGFGLRLKNIGNGSFKIENRRHEAWYFKNTRNGFEREINTFITYDETILSYSWYEYMKKNISFTLKGFIEAGRDTHESRFKRVNNLAIGPEFDLRLTLPAIRAGNLRASLYAGANYSIGIGAQKHDKTNWALVQTSHYSGTLGLNTAF